MTRQGHVRISSLDVDSGRVDEFPLHNSYQVDDHDTPCLIVMPDGHLIAFYSKHSVVDGVINWRRTAHPEDVTDWGPEQSIDTDSVSYPKPALVGDRLYLFYRGVSANQDFVYSDDDGATWSAPQRLFTAGNRPYFNMTDDHEGRVDFICTDGHPRENPNTDLFHFYLDGTDLRLSDGTLIMDIDDLPVGGLDRDDVTKVYDHTTAGQAWGWDITRDEDGHPRCVFATFLGVDDEDHRYRYGRWTGSAWVTAEITPAGGPIGDGSEDQYSGGLGILRSDVDTVYLSRPVSGQWEIERWTTPDDGATWAFAESITTGSSQPQIRPTCPRDTFSGVPDVLWMSGRYTTYLNYDTDLLMHPPVAPD